MKEDKWATCLGLFVSMVILVVVSTIANGWALATIWNWFIPPLFKLVPLTFMQAVGVSMVFRLFINSNSTSETKKDNRPASEIVFDGLVIAILTPVFTVLFAWVIYQFAF